MHKINVLEVVRKYIMISQDLEAIFVAACLLAGICIGSGGDADPKLVGRGVFHGLSVFCKGRVVIVA